jgi:Rod binding domain-containing protein
MEIINDKSFLISDIRKMEPPVSKGTEISEQAARDLQLRAKSREMEALFITEMFKAMEKTVPEDATGGAGNSLPKMMFSSVMGDAVAENGGIGLAHSIYTALKAKDQTPDFDRLKDNALLTNLNVLKAMPISESE